MAGVARPGAAGRRRVPILGCDGLFNLTIIALLSDDPEFARTDGETMDFKTRFIQAVWVAYRAWMDVYTGRASF